MIGRIQRSGLPQPLAGSQCEPDREDEDQQHRDDEDRDREAERRDDRGEVVDPGVAAERRRHAEENAERRADEDAEAAEDEARRPGVGEQAEHGLAGRLVGHAEVELPARPSCS